MPDKIRFGVYELDRDAMELRKHGVLIRLQEQPFRVLAILSGWPGEIITREELQEQIWGKDTFVDFDQSLNKAVNRVREALNDDAGTPQYVETVPRRGYRFVAPVTGNIPIQPTGLTPAQSVSDLDLGVRGEVGPTARRPRFFRPIIASLIVIAVLGAAWLLRTPLPPPKSCAPFSLRAMVWKSGE